MKMMGDLSMLPGSTTYNFVKLLLTGHYLLDKFPLSHVLLPLSYSPLYYSQLD
jgi:hypothetical protein